MVVKKMVSFVIMMLMLVSLHANATSWKINPKNSQIRFTATQNNSPVKGEFKNFNGIILFDPNQLEKSRVEIVIDINSLWSSYQAVADTLKLADWFDAKQFPTATFKADQFSRTSNKTYQAKGNLTIRGQTAPVQFIFTMDDYSDKQAKAEGSLTIKRSRFGVGQGEWKSTDSVKDPVQIDFILSADAE